MTAVTNSITIDRPIEDVFEVLTNVENLEKWFPAKVREWWTSPPPHGVGSTRRASIQIGWFRTQNDAVVTEYEPPRRGVMKGTSPNAPFEATLTFEPVGSGTRVDVRINLAPDGLAKVFIGPFARWYDWQWRHGLANLKRLMESGTL